MPEPPVSESFETEPLDLADVEFAEPLPEENFADDPAPADLLELGMAEEVPDLEPEPAPEPEMPEASGPEADLPESLDLPEQAAPPENVETAIDEPVDAMAYPHDDEPWSEPADDDLAEPAARAMPNSLRARLVREDVSLARPEPTGWSKLAAAWRAFWQRTFG